MTKETATPLTALERESLAWINRLLSGAFTSDDAEALQRWRALDATHEAAFTDAVRFRRKVRELLRLARSATPGEEPVDHHGG